MDDQVKTVPVDPKDHQDLVVNKDKTDSWVHQEPQVFPDSWDQEDHKVPKVLTVKMVLMEKSEMKDQLDHKGPKEKLGLMVQMVSQDVT